ncbi:hypothetical protein HMPREF1012_02120 [Bacillus sp. BT1B_CT2]|uniref:hypothetical protein n=1 Tax=Bacillus sp. BT1B_CT2 TaxID=665958 RepID=UPI0001F4462B|nr:hypothetical protein [Bacillus sp. BT1B_CT2]EFV72240.1 hypothetical protein HMPREF1012_02120 [Bacillus sp. BT1B_CT2]WHF45668.1 hypothetical protein QKW34_04685 [Bacillus licheniformis]
MNTNSLKQGLIFASFSSFLAFPMLAAALLFYHLFSNQTSNDILFNSLSFVMESESAFSFQVKPNFFFIMIGLFIGIFIITAAISSIYQKKRVNLKRACFPEAGFFYLHRQSGCGKFKS